MSRESIKGNTREVIRAHNFEKSLEYKANKETGHPIYFRVEYVSLKVTDYPLLDY